MLKPIREMCLLQSAPLIKAVGNAKPKQTEWHCLTQFTEEQNTVSKAVARIDKSAPKTTSSVVCRKCNMTGHKFVDCPKTTPWRTASTGRRGSPARTLSTVWRTPLLLQQENQEEASQHRHTYFYPPRYSNMASKSSIWPYASSHKTLCLLEDMCTKSPESGHSKLVAKIRFPYINILYAEFRW